MGQGGERDLQVGQARGSRPSLLQHGRPWGSSEGELRTTGTGRSLPVGNKGSQRTVRGEEAIPRVRWRPWAQIPRTPVRHGPPVHSVRHCRALRGDTGRISRVRTMWLQRQLWRDRGLWVREVPPQAGEDLEPSSAHLIRHSQHLVPGQEFFHHGILCE